MIQERNYTLDGWRFIFMVYMILHHFDMFKGIEIPSMTGTINKIFFEGFIGVNFFFMLSGLGCVLGYKDKLETQKISPIGFLCNRIISIWPTYLFFLLTAVFLYNKMHISDVKAFLAQLFMLQSFPITGNIFFSYNALSWCVSDLLFFYLFFAFCYRLDFKKCFSLTILLFLFIIINSLFYNANVMVSLFYISPVFRLLEFLVGMSIALYFKDHKALHSLKLQVLSICILIFFIAYAISGNVPFLYRWSLYYIFPIGLLCFSFYGETTFSKKLFGNSKMIALSKMSIVMYLCHQQILYCMKVYLPENVRCWIYAHFIPLGSLIFVLAIILFSYVFYNIYTRPITRICKAIKNEKI